MREGGGRRRWRKRRRGWKTDDSIVVAVFGNMIGIDERYNWSPTTQKIAKSK